MRKILVVFFGKYMEKFLNEKPLLDEGFFKDEKWWPIRPNSTNRLLLANYEALEMISPFFDIDYISISSIDDLQPYSLASYDVISVNQVANLQCISTLVDLIDLLKSTGLLSKVVFGTELTWALEVTKGKISEQDLDVAYKSSKILRHTAKTDRFVYKKGGSYRECNICEFEIGLNTDVVSSSVDILERKKITFVLAPEGRSTKNNDGAKEIIELIKISNVLKGYDIELVKPPYSTPELWGIYDQSAFLIFTSMGETFSYVLNDAKSKGVVTLYNKAMYNNSIRGEFCVQSYPDSGIKYAGAKDAVNKMQELVLSKNLLIEESKRSRDYVCKNFSISALAKNWFDLFVGKSSLTKTAFVYNDCDFFKSYDDFVYFMHLHGITHVYVASGSEIIPSFSDFSYYEPVSGIVFSKDLRVNGILKSSHIEDEEKDVLNRYFNLYKRIYKVCDLVSLGKAQSLESFNY